jgi:hypothetical protein
MGIEARLSPPSPTRTPAISTSYKIISVTTAGASTTTPILVLVSVAEEGAWYRPEAAMEMEPSGAGLA